ncbi:hypothetical protein [Mucilaginibacter antarcticus]|uniref:Uncharacterized protein n=1 Tax=Mucilaginibacter antarcticus TaxID=1855725 RepID=A0ABW5XRH6_9SPHI
MNNPFMLKLSLLLLMLTTGAALANAQDTLKKVTPAKATVKKAGAIPINPKTGRPYSKYGYGTHAATYKSKLKADSLKKALIAQIPVKPASTIVAPVPQVAKADTALAVAPPKVDKSLNGQYQYLLTKVYNYQRPFIEAFWKNAKDSLKATRTQLNTSSDKITEQAKTITGLQADVSKKEELLTKTDTISLIGIPLAKSTYNMIMWGLVLVFGALAGIVIARSGCAQREARYRTGLYNELEEEFKTFKAKANEKEKKLARELQTERNKVDELMGRG